MEDEKMTNGSLALAPKSKPAAGTMSIAQQREIAQVQAMMVIARSNPREELAAVDRIQTACTRPKLAERGLYEYSKGGTDVTGASIRLAEVMAQNWGNIACGVRELEQTEEESTVEAYAWDLETNFYDSKTFHVPHIRHTKKGSYKLSDPREIYELVANQGARRKRACILAVIPGYVQDEAIKQCEVTLAAKAEVTPERLKNLVEKFAELSVTREMIEKRCQRRLEAITPALMIQLGKIYNSIKDGMSVPADWFGSDRPEAEKGKLDVNDLKPGTQENRGHGNEGLDQVGKQPDKLKTSKTRVETGRAAAPQQQTYSDSEPDPFAPGGDLFGRDPGQEG